ncbi:MAG: AMP-binding protein [Chloroflexota bacterium]
MTATLPPSEWNQTARAYPPDLLPGSFAAQARRTPDAPALRFRDEALSYAELDDRWLRLAAHLLALGAGPARSSPCAWSGRWRWWPTRRPPAARTCCSPIRSTLGGSPRVHARGPGRPRSC